MTRGSLAAFTAFALLGVSVAVHGQGLDADAFFAKGVQLHQAGDLVGAIEAYQAALEKDPERVDARSNLGAAYVRLGRYTEAIESYRAVLARVPDQAQVRFNLALALYKAAPVTEAAEELQRVVAQDPSNLRALLLLAECRQRLGDDADVIRLLSPHEKELGEDRLFAYIFGNALLRRNELARGRAYVDRLFKGGETAEAHLLLGVAQLRTGDSKAAVPEFERALVLGPDLPTAHSLLGRALMGVGRRDEAQAAFRRELETNPNDFDSNVYVGMYLKDIGQNDEAYEYLKRASRLRPQDPAALYALGALHLAAGRLPDAQAALEGVIAQVPSYRQAHVLLATVYYRNKDKQRGDEHRAIAEKLRSEEQAREPGAADDLGPAYRGEPPGAVAPPAEAAKKPKP
jgi:tetratricopeptide (TPR) repeat protein